MEPTFSQEDEGTGDQNLARQMGWCPKSMQHAWVARWTREGKELMNHEGHAGRNRSWESTSIPLQWADPQPLPAIPGTPQVGRSFFLNELCPVQDFVSVTPTSLTWTDRVGGYEVKLTKGLAVLPQCTRNTVAQFRAERGPTVGPSLGGNPKS